MTATLLSMPAKGALWPYGLYLCRDAAVAFDRKYRPIARFARRGAVALSVPAYDAMRRPCTAVLHLDDVTPVDPEERIEHVDKVYFYGDGTAPRCNRATRIRLQEMIAAVPPLAAEISRRAGVAHA